MEEKNTVSAGKDHKVKILCAGEILLRFTPWGHGLIQEASGFTANYGGSEANVAVSLANLGIESSFFSVVPNNSLGKSALRMLRKNGVDCRHMILSTPKETPSHRLGCYYYEDGFDLRPGRVIYDRKNSAFTEYALGHIDLKEILKDFTWLHISGITPALNKNTRDFTLNCLKTARELDMTISFDGNFRSTLWDFDGARDFCTECLPYVDVLFGIEPYHLWKDPSSHEKGDVKDGLSSHAGRDEHDSIFREFVRRYPNLKCIARHMRYAPSSSENSLKAYMWYQGETLESPSYTFHILDRIGGGDAFAAGLIYAMAKNYAPIDMLCFAVASSVLKHTILGDGNVLDDVSLIKELAQIKFDVKR